MKQFKFAFIFLPLLILTSCSKKTFEIVGEMPGEDGALVILYKDGKVLKDTIHNGKFEIDGSTTNTQLCYMSVTKNGNLELHQPLVVQNRKIKLSIPENAPITIKGGSYNKILFEDLKSPEYIEVVNEEMSLTNRTGRLESLKDKSQEWKAVQLHLKKEELQETYYNNITFTNDDPELVILSALLTSLQHDTEKIMGEVNIAANKLGEDHLLVKKVRQMYQEQNDFINRRKDIEVGQLYTDFTAANIAGDSIQLSPIIKKNKYTLLQFWASWCGPCRKEIPLLKELYSSYKSKGFEIVSFSLDHDKKSWVKASEAEGIYWYNISDLKAFKSSIVKNYPIAGIPANAIIDQNGNIIATNLIKEDLDNFIANLFK